jgi:predicted nuclease of predicted toxin-antitoxin system
MAAIKYYFDEMMSGKVAKQLATYNIEVVVANDTGMTDKDDLAEHLPYATEKGLVLVTFDRKFAGLALVQGGHTGVVCLSGPQNDVGYMIHTLIEIAEQYTLETIAGVVIWR